MNFDVSTFDVLTFNVPTFDVPTFDVPTFDVPTYLHTYLPLKLSGYLKPTDVGRVK